MGGGTITPPLTEEQEEEDSSLDHVSSQLSSALLRSELDTRVEEGDVDKQSQSESVFGDYGRLSDRAANERKRQDVYRKIMQSYEELEIQSKNLKEAKIKLLSYIPGTWNETAGSMKRRDYYVPKTTSLLLVGPKGSGKSSLVNRISKVLEDEKFASERAQVSYNSSVGDGTIFLQEYMIPRSSTSICIYDTRSLSDDSAENIKMLKHWMENGVRHGELCLRDSDSQSLRTAMMCKARDNGYLSSEIRKVNFVLFTVNGLSVLKSLEGEEDAGTRYTEMVASTFNSPYLAFKDDKPLVVVTHGDLLSRDERARVRVHVGELLGISPITQIFDIPENSDTVTEARIIDMLLYSLEHAEKNLPHKRKLCMQVPTLSLLPWMVLLMILGTATNLWCLYHHAHHLSPQQQMQHCHSLQTHVHHCPLPEAHIQQDHDPLPQEHIHHCTSAQAHVSHSSGPSPEMDNQQVPSARSWPSDEYVSWAHIQKDIGPLPQEHIRHQAHVLHNSGSSPEMDSQHGPSTPFADSALIPPLPQEKTQDGPFASSSEARPHDDTSSPLPSSLQEHLHHGPLTRVQAEFEKIKTQLHHGPLPRVQAEFEKLMGKVEKIKTHLHHSALPRVQAEVEKLMAKADKMRTELDWSKIRHLYLDEDSKMHINWKKIRHLYLDEESK